MRREEKHERGKKKTLAKEERRVETKRIRMG